MSGTFGENALNFFSGTKDFYSHKINQSLRFEDGDSAQLVRTPSSSGNTQTFTYSGWIKRGNVANLSYPMTLLSAGPTGSSGTDSFSIFYTATPTDDYLRVQEYSGGGFQLELETSAFYRDPTAWYNVVVSVDTTNSTADDRVKIYINGEEVTSFGDRVNPSLNFNTNVNSTTAHSVGDNSGTYTWYFDGYMAEINLIDGTALDASSFGETKAGIWIPKDTSGLTFGTNGFRLKFQDSSALGDDTSGNGNDFSVTNLAATDVVLDSPTNNWATMNPLNGDGGTTWKEGNLELSTANKGNNASTFLMKSGKWYWEAIGTYPGYVGAVCAFDRGAYNNTMSVSGSDSIGYYSTGAVYWGTGSNSTPAAYVATDIIGVAVNMDDGEISFYKNNSLEITLAFSSTISRLATEGCYACYNNGSTSTTKEFNVNFGQDSSFAGNKTAQGNTDDNGNGDFYYSPPSGFLALCSANLPDPAIDPAQDEEPADNFNTVLYTGNNGSQSVTGVGFQPDWVWLKRRNDENGHKFYDVIRGVGINFNIASSVEASSANGYFTSFDSDGFSLAGGDNAHNTSSAPYVAWNWLAGGSPVTNNDGSFTSSVSANTKAGFSIVTHDNGSGTRTVGHGLDSAPEIIFEKKRDSSGDWLVQFTVLDGTNDYMRLNTTASKTNGAGALPTSTVFTPNVGGGADCLAYCFHSVDGYSKVGSYTGNGSSDGVYVFTGFRPAWLIVKKASATQSWAIMDNKRQNSFNDVDARLFANLSDVEATGEVCDFLSNGFKMRSTFSTTNSSSATYLYLAFAEQPFKYANAR